ncbi:hypothetical protein SAMN06265368_2868 [Cohaesibacter gelatinilyticus]|uniref:Uncharacterized protein n=1 Tax=Cohaesibacter gelatinilyticus TaxID=372072 RepID=A0A285PI30_9HYPH|nr:hypothetical protein SAMN06265368_2868 [Cohaesibacter gelatinilyticus]
MLADKAAFDGQCRGIFGRKITMFSEQSKNTKGRIFKLRGLRRRCLVVSQTKTAPAPCHKARKVRSYGAFFPFVDIISKYGPLAQIAANIALERTYKKSERSMAYLAIFSFKVRRGKSSLSMALAMLPDVSFSV